MPTGSITLIQYSNIKDMASDVPTANAAASKIRRVPST